MPGLENISNYASCKKNIIFARVLRFHAIFSIFLILGIVFSARSEQILDSFDANIYFSSFAFGSVAEYLENCITSSLFDLLMIILVTFSALTFCCSGILNCISAFSGTVYGFCAGCILFKNGYYTKCSVIYALYIIALSLLLSFYQAQILATNKSFIKKKSIRISGTSPYISKDFFAYLLLFAKAMLIFSLLRLLLCISIPILG